MATFAEVSRRREIEQTLLAQSEAIAELRQLFVEREKMLTLMRQYVYEIKECHRRIESLRINHIHMKRKLKSVHLIVDEDDKLEDLGLTGAADVTE